MTCQKSSTTGAGSGPRLSSNRPQSSVLRDTGKIIMPTGFLRWRVMHSLCSNSHGAYLSDEPLLSNWCFPVAGQYMSQHPVTIVDIDVDLTEAPAQAARMVAWLQSEGIIGEGVRTGELYRRWLSSIGSNHASERVNDPKVVYPPGPSVSKACKVDLSGLFYNWLEVDIERQVFTAGEHGFGIFCPSCTADQTETGRKWGDAISDWYEGGDGKFSCAACGIEAPVVQWTFDPVWAFGNLGFRFCDWVLEPAFILAFQEKLGNESKVVYAHL
jgi:hypothetical protein